MSRWKSRQIKREQNERESGEAGDTEVARVLWSEAQDFKLRTELGHDDPEYVRALLAGEVWQEITFITQNGEKTFRRRLFSRRPVEELIASGEIN